MKIDKLTQSDSTKGAFLHFSASREDYEWVKRLKHILDGTLKAPILIDSTPGNSYLKHLDDASNNYRYRIVIILLSPDYILEVTSDELAQLDVLAKSGQITFIPIVLRQCNWQELAFLQGTQIWSQDKPITELDKNAAENVLDQIAASIEVLVNNELNIPGKESSTRFHFSPATEKLLILAKDLAKKSRRAGVTSSCLFFAVTESIDNSEDTVCFFRDAMKRNEKKYSEELHQFLKNTNLNKGEGVNDCGSLLGKVSDNTLELLTYAKELALQTSDGSPEIHQRHMIVALFIHPEQTQITLNRLKRLGIKLSVLLSEFREFLRQNEYFGESSAEWDRILGQGDGPKPSVTLKPLTPGEKTLRDFLQSTDFGAAMDAADLRALRVGAMLAQSKSKPIYSIDLLYGYLLNWSHDDGSAEAALSVIIWFCLTDGRQEEVNFWKALRLESERDRLMEAINRPEVGDDWKVSDELVTLALRSLRLAQATHPGEPVCTRHLLACLIGQTGKEIDPTALSDLERLSIDINIMRAMYRNWLAIERKSDLAQPLDEALGVTAEQAKGRWNAGFRPRLAMELVPEKKRTPFLAGVAGYTTEFCGVGGSGVVLDHLGVEEMAERLAELIANRDTKLPLAVGLFGNWGSGKSHFMNLMDRSIIRLAHETPEDWAQRAAIPGVTLRPDPTGQGPWCRKIVPIYFNAWHYVDTNLWASLVSQIFDSLFAYLRPKEDDLEALQKLLEQASGATARAAEDLLIAEAATVKAKTDLANAEKALLDQQATVKGLLQSLSNLLPTETHTHLKTQVVEWLGVRKDMETLGELEQVVEEARSLGRVRILWNAVYKSQGRNQRIIWLVLVAIATVLSTISPDNVPFLKDWLQGIGQGISRIFAGLLACIPVPWIRSILVEFGTRLKQMEDWLKEAESARQRARATPEVMQAETNLAITTAREAAARTGLINAEAKERQLREEEMSLLPERRLGRFIEQRAQSSDYRGQLGLVSLARRDFQELSDIFTNIDLWKAKHAPSPMYEDAQKLKAEQQIELGNQLIGSIDRIVLFVDDLDRCKPEKVVDVLQAVHLLLAFPLFAVVVGVDQRCLRQSLRMQFKGLLTQELEAGSTNGQGTVPSIDKDERPATPLDYLEKIFHIPFHLPPMDKKGFGTLIEKLSEPSDKAKQKSIVDLPKKSRAEETVDIAEEPTKVIDKTLPYSDTVPAPVAIGIEGEHFDETRPTTSSDKEVSIDTGNTPHSQVYAHVIGSAPLYDWERAALKDYHLLIQTPRGATRLLNTYRLVRAGITAEEWDAFRGDEADSGEFRLAMLLLASAAGYPSVAREWFEVLRNNINPTELNAPDDILEVNPQAWKSFKSVYDDTLQKSSVHLTNELFSKWLDRVERFTF